LAGVGVLEKPKGFRLELAGAGEVLVQHTLSLELVRVSDGIHDAHDGTEDGCDEH
jgi:hypothetical protein